MYDYSTFPDDLVFFVDMKSFYASVSCILMGLDPLKVKLAVVGDVSRDGSVVLAATPEMKKLGIKTLFGTIKKVDMINRSVYLSDAFDTVYDLSLSSITDINFMSHV